jgi:hypothetical protein
MRESVLRDYFLGLVDEQQMSEDLAGSAVKTSYDVITCYVTDDLTEDFEVNASYLIRLCDAFLTGKLKAEHLELIGFALEMSEHFTWWDDDNLEEEDTPAAETIHAWASPEINYPLTAEIIAKFKHLLLTGERIFTREDVAKQAKKRKD